MKEVQDRLGAELSGQDYAADHGATSKYLSSRVKGAATSKDIQRFFKKHRNLYSKRSKRWTGIPDKCTSEKVLYPPFLKILKAIISHFGLSEKRRAIDTSGTKIAADQPSVSNPLDIRPDFTVIGYYEGGECPVGWRSRSEASKGQKEDSADVLLMQAITAFDAKLTRQRNRPQWTCQLASYARHFMTNQNNRRCMYEAIITEEDIEVFQFDTGGYLRSATLGYHSQPELFIQILLYLIADPDHASFDKSIFWENAVRYILFKKIAYEVAGYYPHFCKQTLTGRATTCWLVEDVDNADFLIKQYWLSDTRTQEYEFLEDAKGLDGVAQMIDWEVVVDTRVSDSRWAPMKEVNGFTDRVLIRIRMKSYGPPIYKFKSKLQLLTAFRDAVAGHFNLWKKNILHRDISIDNILLGKDGAPVGNRGILVDLDMATRWSSHERIISSDDRTGTWVFLSVSILKSFEDSNGNYPPQDYLDDFESFLYVMCWICRLYNAPGVLAPRNSPLRNALEKWDDTKAALESKKGLVFGRRPSPLNQVNPYFGSIFSDLITDVWKVISEAAIPKIDRLDDGREPVSDATVIAAPAEAHYAAFLKCIDDAITKLQAEESQTKAEATTVAEVAPQPPLPITSPLTPLSSESGPMTASTESSGIKRKVPSDQKEEPSSPNGAKRVRTMPVTPDRTSSSHAVPHRGPLMLLPTPEEIIVAAYQEQIHKGVTEEVEEVSAEPAADDESVAVEGQIVEEEGIDDESAEMETGEGGSSNDEPPRIERDYDFERGPLT